ncbi:Alpha/Beta hydrolase protein [Gigaspora rosea]|uniref:Alpha/Beta hydrolase protein n=1 Tax=Gigaspora rosea TaxID=44941 RepID=A0A397VD15_9GLOM|nr:Alpha/Beta hydrolase protein [Gigaspora rosea]
MSEQFTDDSVDKSVKVADKWIESSDGVEIYTRTWKAVSDNPIATVVFLHGFGEHITRYDHVFDKFGRKNIEVYAYDQRGFGKTADKYNNKGQTGGWNVIKKDITEALISQRREGIPQFLMGHSMGGGLALRYACEGVERHNIAGYAISSPWLRLSPKASSIGLDIGLFFLPTLSLFVPNQTFSVGKDSTYLSRDPVQRKNFDDDLLNHDIFSLLTRKYLYVENWSWKREYINMTSPIYLAHGSADMCTDINASKQFIQSVKSSNTMFREWEGRYHEMHNDYGNREVIQSYVQWILEQVNSAS